MNDGPSMMTIERMTIERARIRSAGFVLNLGLLAATALAATATVLAPTGARAQGGWGLQSPGLSPFPPGPREYSSRGIYDRDAGRGITVSGRVIAGPERLDEMMEVRIETAGRVWIASAYTDRDGLFTFRDLILHSGRPYEIIVEEEGFAPYREPLDGFVSRNYGAFLELALRPHPPETERGPSGGLVVDAGQLALEIPDDVRQEFERAREFFDEGRDLEAIACLENVVERVPDFYEAHEALGMSYIRLRRFDDARDALVRAHDLSPASPGPLLNLGTALYRKGESLEAAGKLSAARDQFDQAAAALRKATERDPFSGPGHLRLGATLYQLGELDRAEAELHRTLEVAPEVVQARLVLVNVYASQGRFAEALNQADLFIEANPESIHRPAIEKIRRQIETQLAHLVPGEQSR